MRKASISIEIASAVTETGGMAVSGDGRTEWYMPKDLRRFRELTSETATSMAIAACTFRAMRLQGYPLFSGRCNIVVGELDEDVALPPDHAAALDCAEALELARESGSHRMFLVGDSKFYGSSFGLVQRLHLTVVQGNYATQEQFPDFSTDFRPTYEGRPETEDNGISYVFRQYERLNF